MIDYFVDISIKENELVHNSQLANRFVKKMADVVSLNQHIQLRVTGIDPEHKRVHYS